MKKVFLTVLFALICTMGFSQVSFNVKAGLNLCLLYTSPSPRDVEESRMPSSA